MDENEGEHAGSPLQSGRTRRFAPTVRANTQVRPTVRANTQVHPYNQGEHAGSPLQSGRTRRFAPTVRANTQVRPYRKTWCFVGADLRVCPHHKSFARASNFLFFGF